MAAAVYGGPVVLAGNTDEFGFRTYTVRFRVKADVTDGPARVLAAAGLPVPGAAWAILSESDPWVWFRKNGTATLDQHKAGEPHRWWVVDCTASNKPLPPSQQGRPDYAVNNPLTEPQKVSGGGGGSSSGGGGGISGKFSKHTIEAKKDRFGNRLVYSSHEQMAGKEVEFERFFHAITIEQTVAALELSLISSCLGCVNDAPLWGVPKRCVRLANASWAKKWYGSGSIYFTRTFEFDVGGVWDPQRKKIVSGFDRDVLDEGTKVLRGHWVQGGPDGVAWLVEPLKKVLRTLTVQTMTLVAVEEMTRVTFTAAHGLAAGDTIVISGAIPDEYNGTYPVLDVTTTTEVTIPTPDIAQGWMSGGTAAVHKMPSSRNPADFIRATDYPAGNYVRLSLDGFGRPALGRVVTITSISFDGQGSMTVFMAENHNLKVDQEFGIVGADPPYLDGSHVVTAVLTPTQVKAPEPVTGATWTAGGKALLGAYEPAKIHVEYYPERNLLLLGIPTSLETV